MSPKEQVKGCEVSLQKTDDCLTKKAWLGMGGSELRPVRTSLNHQKNSEEDFVACENYIKLKSQCPLIKCIGIHTATPICFCIFCDCLHATTGELGAYGRDCRSCKAGDIYYVALCRKSLLIHFRGSQVEDFWCMSIRRRQYFGLQDFITSERPAQEHGYLHHGAVSLGCWRSTGGPKH